MKRAKVVLMRCNQYVILLLHRYDALRKQAKAKPVLKGKIKSDDDEISVRKFKKKIKQKRLYLMAILVLNIFLYFIEKQQFMCLKCVFLSN